MGDRDRRRCTLSSKGLIRGYRGYRTSHFCVISLSFREFSLRVYMPQIVHAYACAFKMHLD